MKPFNVGFITPAGKPIEARSYPVKGGFHVIPDEYPHLYGIGRDALQAALALVDLMHPLFSPPKRGSLN